MRRRHQHIDPYLTMLKQLERRAWACGLIAGITLAAAIYIAAVGSEGAGLHAATVDQLRRVIGLGLLCACGTSCALSLWFVGRYIYFAKWPERFEYHS